MNIDHSTLCMCGHGLGWHVGPEGVGLGSGPACHCGCYSFCPLRVGMAVRMTRRFRRQQRWSGWKYHGVSSGRRHIREFGRLVGIVEGFVDYNNVPRGDRNWCHWKIGPEVNVRWPSGGHGLRYMYRWKDLEIVT